MVDGPAAALEPRSRRPKQSPSKLTDDVAAQAVAIRAALEQSGLDHGPISVHEKMRSLGMDAGASRSLRWRGSSATRALPGSSRGRSRRASYRRFVYPAYRTRAGSWTEPNTF